MRLFVIVVVYFRSHIRCWNNKFCFAHWLNRNLFYYPEDLRPTLHTHIHPSIHTKIDIIYLWWWHEMRFAFWQHIIVLYATVWKQNLRNINTHFVRVGADAVGVSIVMKLNGIVWNVFVCVCGLRVNWMFVGYGFQFLGIHSTGRK